MTIKKEVDCHKCLEKVPRKECKRINRNWRCKPCDKKIKEEKRKKLLKKTTPKEELKIKKLTENKLKSIREKRKKYQRKQNEKRRQERREELKICRNCNCMTKTKEGTIYNCGKCGADRRRKEKPKIIPLKREPINPPKIKGQKEKKKGLKSKRLFSIGKIEKNVLINKYTSGQNPKCYEEAKKIVHNLIENLTNRYKEKIKKAKNKKQSEEELNNKFKEEFARLIERD